MKVLILLSLFVLLGQIHARLDAQIVESHQHDNKKQVNKEAINYSINNSNESSESNSSIDSSDGSSNSGSNNSNDSNDNSDSNSSIDSSDGSSNSGSNNSNDSNENSDSNSSIDSSDVSSNSGSYDSNDSNDSSDSNSNIDSSDGSSNNVNYVGSSNSRRSYSNGSNDSSDSNSSIDSSDGSSSSGSYDSNDSNDSSDSNSNIDSSDGSSNNVSYVGSSNSGRSNSNGSNDSSDSSDDSSIDSNSSGINANNDSNESNDIIDSNDSNVRHLHHYRPSRECRNGLESASKCCSKVPKHKKVFLPHPKYCNQFYKCKKMKAILKSCPRNKQWSVKKQRCMKPRHVNCNNVDHYETSKECLNGQELASKCCSEVPKHEKVFLQHPKNCNKFYKCKKGEAVLKKCPKNKQWSVRKQRCLKPIFAECKIVEFPTTTLPTTTPMVTSTEITATITSTTTESSGGGEGSCNITSRDCRHGIISAEECCKGHNVLLQNNDNCGTYFQCVNEKPMIRECSGGLRWNADLCRCEWPGTSTCNI